MDRFATREIAIALAISAVFIAAGYGGLTIAMGAHPFWAVKVVWIGLLLGVPVYGLAVWLMRTRLIRLGAIAVLLAGSAAVVVIGKGRFAASYAEDFMAGRMWYFGWMAAICFAAVLVMTVLSARGQK